jgi:dolichol-phosphate mannosyltransferase
VNGEYVAYTDADGATPPQEILNLLEKINGYDGVIGSRWLRGSVVVVKQRPSRRIASRGFNILTRLILGLRYRDTQCPAKVFRRDVVKSIARGLKVKDFAFDACMLYFAKKMGYRIKEVPITWKDKAMSSVSISRASVRMFVTILKMRFRDF